jgi:trimeric autotransporter adhesin
MRTTRLTFVSIVCAVWCVSALASDRSGTSDWSKLPAAAQTRVSAALGREAADYYARPVSGGYETGGSRQEMSARFTAAGVEVSHGSARWGMALRGYGHGDVLENVRAAAPRASKNRVEYRRGLMTEWYVNGPAGLEQGFTIERRPQGAKGPLTVALELSSELTATADGGGTGLKLSDQGGREQMRYTGLTAYDAGGKELRASLGLQGRELTLRVEDAGARYPVVIDPVVQMAKLTSSDGQGTRGLGVSVAIGGNVIVVGTGSNVAYVFVKPPSGWQDMTETARLTDSSGLQDSFGLSVAISGNIIVVGAPYANQNQGAAYAFVKPTKGWRDMTETAQLAASDGVPGDQFGISVSVSGNAALVGAFEATVNGNPLQGAAYVFTRPIVTKESANSDRLTLTETGKLIASDGVQGTLFGGAVSISGNTAAIGATVADGGVGEAYVFVKPQTGWTNMTESAELKPSDEGGSLGASIATNGTTVVAGVPSAGAPRRKVQGAAYVFVEPTGGWADMTETAQLLPPKISGDLDGSVAIDSAGHAVAVGSPQGYGNANDAGQVYVFVEPPGGWQTTAKPNFRLFTSDGQPGDNFGYSVSLSGQTLVAGAPSATIGNNRGQGAAYVFGVQ